MEDIEEGFPITVGLLHNKLGDFLHNHREGSNRDKTCVLYLRDDYVKTLLKASQEECEELRRRDDSHKRKNVLAIKKRQELYEVIIDKDDIIEDLRRELRSK